jgi:hypothetical protein
MWDLNTIAEYSRCHCVGICAVLIPTNLVLSSITIALTATAQPIWLIRGFALANMIPALVLILHVISWWIIGVVMLPTFILPLLSITCLTIALYAMLTGDRSDNYLRRLFLNLFVWWKFPRSSDLDGARS